MRLLLAMSLLALSTTTFAAEISLNKEGKFVNKHTVGMFGYKNSKECKADGGKFKDGICLFDSEDTVEVSKLVNGNFKISIEKVGTNAHMCNFESESVEENQVQLKAIGIESEGCELAVSYTSQDTLSVITNGQCNEYCGANMNLDLDSALRSK